MSNASVVLRNVTKFFGPNLALADVSFTLGPDTRMGVVGRNGAGKSTLLKIVAGIDQADAGTVERMPSSATIGYLPQETERSAEESVLEYLARRTGVAAAIAELDAASNLLAVDTADAADRYDRALEGYLSLGAADFSNRVESVAADLGLSPSLLGLPMDALSGGQAARVALAAVLLSRFDILLLDEPTNDLDFTGLDRLEKFVMNSKQGMLLVSHDRQFLERTTNSVLDLDHVKHTAAEFRGGWLAYTDAKATAARHAQERYSDYQSQKATLAGRAQRQKQWSDQGVSKAKKSGETDKFIRHHAAATSEKVAAKSKITEKALERLEEVERPWEGWDLRMELPQAGRSGDVVCYLEDAVVQRGSFTLGPLTMEVAYGERIAITGPNGSGKSTLINALLGRVPLSAGRQHMGPSVVVGELDQIRSVFEGDAPMIERFVEESGLLPADARSLLAKFDLSAEQVGRTGQSLSPGQRTRAVLALLMARRTNCLVLDEPTNHLDVDAIEQLEQALDTFSGTVLLVTHDRRMLETTRITRTIDLTEDI